MIKIWGLILLALLVQEPASTDAAIFQVRSLHLNIISINLAWILLTSLDIAGGYFIGKWIQKRFMGSRFEIFSSKWGTRVEEFVGRKGEKFALLLLGIINFPWVNGFLGSWLKLNFKTVFSLIFIGDLIYWILAWIINISVRSLPISAHFALYVVVGIGLIFSILSKTILNRVLRDKQTLT